MKTAFITGITGQDGSYLAELLLSKGYRVVAMKRRTSLISTNRIDHLIENKNLILEYGNLNDSGCIHRLLLKYKPDELYNLAAQSHVRVSFEAAEEVAEFVAMGTLRILEACRNVSPETRIYQASSSEMFGETIENHTTCTYLVAYFLIMNHLGAEKLSLLEKLLALLQELNWACKINYIWGI